MLGLINQHVEDNAIVVNAAGSLLRGDLQRLWQVKCLIPIIWVVTPAWSYEIAAAAQKLARQLTGFYAMVGMK